MILMASWALSEIRWLERVIRDEIPGGLPEGASAVEHAVRLLRRAYSPQGSGQVVDVPPPATSRTP